MENKTSRQMLVVDDIEATEELAKTPVLAEYENEGKMRNISE